MGLDADFLALLTGTVVLKRDTGEDTWGNETFGAPETLKAFVSDEEATYGSADEGGEQEKEVVKTASVLLDAVGAKIGDHLVHNNVEYTVTGVTTYRDEFGADLYQSVSIENQQKG